MITEEQIQKQREAKKRYRERNKDKIKEKDKIYRENNKEAIKERNRKWRVNNREKSNASRRKWALNNPEDPVKRRIRSKKYWSANKNKQLFKVKLWRSENKERIKGYSLKQRYNLTIEKYNELCTIQDNKCKICFKKVEDCVNKILVVDHNHLTGEIRGLLCNNCNVGIGLLQEDSIILQNAINYLTNIANGVSL